MTLGEDASRSHYQAITENANHGMTRHCDLHHEPPHRFAPLPKWKPRTLTVDHQYPATVLHWSTGYPQTGTQLVGVHGWFGYFDSP
jgi:hypothetical protein